MVLEESISNARGDHRRRGDDERRRRRIQATALVRSRSILSKFGAVVRS